MDVFGTMEDVEELVKAVHDRNMRIIFDLVFGIIQASMYCNIYLNIKQQPILF